MQIAEQHPPDGAGMRQPLLRGTRSEAEALGRAVVLVHDRPPPLHHRVFDLLGTRRCRVDRHFERGQIVAQARRFGQLEHATEHGGHQLTVRHTILLDQRQIVFWLEALHDDGGRAVADREPDRRLWRRMIERCGGQIDHVVSIAPQCIHKLVER